MINIEIERDEKGVLSIKDLAASEPYSRAAAATYRLRQVGKVSMNAQAFVDEVCAVFDVMADFRPQELIAHISKFDEPREVLFYEYEVVEEYPNSRDIRIVAGAQIRVMTL